MRMRNERNAAWRRAVLARFIGQIERNLDLADRTIDQELFRMNIHGAAYPSILKRSTTLPFARCDSTISSMSLSST